MRTIKFRGLRTDGKGWIYGLPFYSYGTGCWKITTSNGWVPSYSNPDEGESTEFYDVDVNTISEFTGLHDKNGNEIYEGDICQTWFFALKSEIVHIVNIHGAFWHKHPTEERYSNLHGTCKPYSKELYQTNYYEIIGNIHQNK